MKVTLLIIAILILTLALLGQEGWFDSLPTVKETVVGEATNFDCFVDTCGFPEMGTDSTVIVIELDTIDYIMIDSLENKIMLDYLNKKVYLDKSDSN